MSMLVDLPEYPERVSDAIAADLKSFSLAVLDRLPISPAEREVSFDEIDFRVELAMLWQLEPIDRANPQGAFGPAELWLSIVVPAARVVLELRARDLTAGELERELKRQVSAIAASSNARASPEELVQLLTALGETIEQERGGA
jgi:hypothetical protein